MCKAGDGSCQWFGRRSRQIVRSVGAASSPPGRLFLLELLAVSVLVGERFFFLSSSAFQTRLGLSNFFDGLWL